GNGTMYLERFVENPRHIEVQILADTYGDVIQLGERECSIQRRHQKLIEESPSAAITQELREKMGLAAVRAAKACGYINAGTIEFLLDKTGEFFFMEMNTRIQVEHGVTEMVTGMDLIKEQIRITAGERLSHTQEQVILRGHAIECRINAEDPSHNFRPSPGTIQELHFPGGNGIRVDSALFRGYKIPPNYDSMIGKVMVHDDTRLGAIKKMQSALGEIVVEGVITNRDYQYEIISHPVFQSGAFDTGFIEQYMEGKK
ncbi:MAG: acetyl-CoA carboxylase biotin carboxylase subunit, partial [Lachnospiraceae bacterium]